MKAAIWALAACGLGFGVPALAAVPPEACTQCAGDVMAQQNDVALSHVLVTASDHDRAITFYTKALGFKVGFERTVEEAFNPTLRLRDVKFREAFLVLGDMMLTVICFERPESIPAPVPASNRLGMQVIAFKVADIDAVAQRVVKYGGHVDEKTRYTNQFGTTLIVTDPDGTQLELVKRTN
jgi:lactoylglutathione lyase